jgi:hypothetical protein
LRSKYSLYIISKEAGLTGTCSFSTKNYTTESGNWYRNCCLVGLRCRNLPANTLIPLQRLHSLAFGFGTSAYAEDRASSPHDGLLRRPRPHALRQISLCSRCVRVKMQRASQPGFSKERPVARGREPRRRPGKTPLRDIRITKTPGYFLILFNPSSPESSSPSKTSTAPTTKRPIIKDKVTIIKRKPVCLSHALSHPGIRAGPYLY